MSTVRDRTVFYMEQILRLYTLKSSYKSTKSRFTIEFLLKGGIATSR